MGREGQKDLLKALDYYIQDIVDWRIASYIKRNKNNRTKNLHTTLQISQPINIALPLGWHPEKIEKLKLLHHFLSCFGIIACNYLKFETHFTGVSDEKILWFGTRTELMYLILQLINPPLKLIPPPAKNNLNIIVSGHFRDTEGDFSPEVLKVSKSKGIGKKDRLDLLDEIIEALNKSNS